MSFQKAFQLRPLGISSQVFQFHLSFTFCSLCFSFHSRLHYLMIQFRSFFYLKNHGSNSDRIGHQFAFTYCLPQILHRHMNFTQIFEFNWEDFHCSFSNFEISSALFDIVIIYQQHFPLSLQFEILRMNHWDLNCNRNLFITAQWLLLNQPTKYPKV